MMARKRLGIWLRLSLLWPVVAMLGGCEPTPLEPAPTGTSEPRAPLRVLVVDRVRWGDEIERRWNADAETPIEVVSATSEAFEPDQVKKFDVVVYPSRWTPLLADRGLLLPLDEQRFESESWNAADVLPLESGVQIRWGKQTMGVSLGHSPWVLAYRESRLRQVGKEVPNNWPALDDLVQALLRDRHEKGQPPTVLAYPSEGTDGGEMLLARVGSSVRHRGAFSGLFDLGQTRPLLTTEPFLEALRWFDSPGLDTRNLAAEGCWEALVAGEIDLAILPLPTRGDLAQVLDSAAVADETSGEASPIRDVRMASLPGSSQVFISGSGWRKRGSDESMMVPYLGTRGTVVSICRDSRRAGSAWGLVQWLGGKRTQSLWAPVASKAFPARYSSLAAVDRWLPEGLSDAAIEDVIEIIRQMQESGVAMTPARVPKSESMLSALTAAVQEARGGGDAAMALDKATAQWQDQIDSTGTETFLIQNEKGLGL